MKNKVYYYLHPIIYDIKHFLAHIFAKDQIKDAYAKMELEVRTDFFERVCPDKKDKFDEAYKEVWLPLYNDYIDC